ncbi:MAG: Hsp70 family protein [Flavobacteriaceae bacterium]|nr:Hsp70 family protein [Flavobacteriaceae bacterium]
MNRVKFDYGIDLGTTNSAIARMENGVPTIKKTDTLKDTMPSCVYFNKKKSIWVGDKAYNILKSDQLEATRCFKKHSSNSFIEFKRTMGTDKMYYSSNMKDQFSSEELSSQILKTLRSFVSEENFSSVVITVPSNFNLTQIDATQKAAELSGFFHIELLQEPVAASMAFGLNPNKSDGFWMVFDFGGGTFDVALIRVEDGIMKVVDSDGDNHLGGKDIDYTLVDSLIIPHLRRQFNITGILNNNPKKTIFRDALKFFAEEAKIQLSFKDEYELYTDLNQIPAKDDDGKEIELDFTITIEELRKTVEPIFQKAIDKSISLINRNNLSPSELSQVLLVGGSTYSPILREMVKNKISKNVNFSIDPLTAVATGAALYASTRDIPLIYQKRDSSKIQLELKYESTSVELEEFITIKLLKDKSIGNVPLEVFIEIKNSDKSWSSGKIQIENADVLEVILTPNKANNFLLSVFDKHGNILESEPNNFTIIQGTKVGDSILPFNIGIEIKNIHSGKDSIGIIPGLEKNNSIPCEGKTKSLKTQKDIIPGIKDDFIKVPIYEGGVDFEGTRAILNTHIKDVIISGIDLPKFLPCGSEVELTLKIDSSRRMKFKAYFPHLQYTLESDIPRTISPVISSEKLESEILSAKNKIHLLQQDNNSKNVDILHELDKDINDIHVMFNNGMEDEDNRNKVLERLRINLKKSDRIQETYEWTNVEEDLRYSLKRLIILNSRYGNSSYDEILREYSQNVNKVISEKDIKVGKELVDLIRSLNFKIYDEGAGVALEINIIKGFDKNFETHDWSNSNQARKFIDEAKNLINTNPIKSDLRDIVLKLYNLLPNSENALDTNDESLLTN